MLFAPNKKNGYQRSREMKKREIDRTFFFRFFLLLDCVQEKKRVNIIRGDMPWLTSFPHAHTRGTHTRLLKRKRKGERLGSWPIYTHPSLLKRTKKKKKLRMDDVMDHNHSIQEKICINEKRTNARKPNMLQEKYLFLINASYIPFFVMLARRDMKRKKKNALSFTPMPSRRAWKVGLLSGMKVLSEKAFLSANL